MKEIVKIYILSLNTIKDNQDLIVKHINENQLKDALKYKKNDDYLRKIGSSYLIDKYIGGDIIYNAYGKPLSNKVRFNISHGGEYVCLGISNYEIGIDIEKIEDLEYTQIENALSKDELKIALDNRAVYTIWTNKESLLKCIGVGLIDDLKTVPGDGQGIVKYEQKEYYRKWLNYNNYSLSITIKNNENFDCEIQEINMQY